MDSYRVQRTAQFRIEIARVEVIYRVRLLRAILPASHNSVIERTQNAVKETKDPWVF